MQNILIEYDQLYVGMKVLDLDPDFGEGYVTEIMDEHNILVHYLHGSSLHCLVSTCEDYDPIYYTSSMLRHYKLLRILKKLKNMNE